MAKIGTKIMQMPRYNASILLAHMIIRSSSFPQSDSESQAPSVLRLYLSSYRDLLVQGEDECAGGKSITILFTWKWVPLLLFMLV